VLNFPSAGPATCCGFYQPALSFANSFKTDPATGLPFLDGSYDYNGGPIVPAANGASPGNTSTLKSDQGVLSTDATYMPDTTTTLDSRIDWTIGRRGISFLDWGPMPGTSWDRDQIDNGPYINVKDVYRKAAAATTSDAYGNWATGQSTAINFNMIRYSDILLWAAEVEVEIGSLENARLLVNQVRNRAANPAGFVMGRLRGYVGGDATQTIVAANVPSANYFVKPYPAGAFVSQAYARNAVQFERRLEFGMEGVRFFDLQRWDGLYGGPMPAGFMASTLNANIKINTSYPLVYFGNGVLNGAVFTQGRNEIYPIPIAEINKEGGPLKQNPGYN
jgi:starch-binding outer membrane protein, SusD/RagB family